MKTLYIHGLDSLPVPEKLEILRQSGMEVIALHLDYRTQTDAYQILKDTIIREEVRFLVGSSLGGYLAYWLSEDLGLPCLLFNPAMSFHDTFKHQIPEIQNLLSPVKFVVIGKNDEVVDPRQNVEFFKAHTSKHCHLRLIECEWLGHKIDFVSFKEMVVWALKSHELWSSPNFSNNDENQ